MAFGADLVADDQVILKRRRHTIYASCPSALRGLIEARGVGLLRARPSGPVPVFCIVDLDAASEARLPPLRHDTVLGCTLPLLHPSSGVVFAAALMQYLRNGRAA